MNDLALQVGIINHIIINQTDVADPRGGQIERHRRTQSSGADHQYRGSFELLLPFQANFRDQEMA